MISSFIKTKRFFLKPLMLKDVKKHYYNWFNEKEIKRFLKNTIYKNLNDLKNYTEIEISKKDVVFFGIFTKSNFHIGNIKLYNIKKNHSCELGLIIGDKKWRNKHVGKEVITSCIKEVRKHCGITFFKLGVDSLNFSAYKTYSRIGFRIIKYRQQNRLKILDMVYNFYSNEIRK